MDAPLAALLVEDSTEDAELIARHLRRAFGTVAMEQVRDLAGLRGALAARAWDVVLADHSMPSLRPPDTVRELRERALDVPVIIVSGRLNPYAAVSALQAGARDYVGKDDLGPLAGIIRREVAEARERRRTLERVARPAALWRTVVDAAAVGLVAIDGDGRVVAVNPTAARQLGTAAAALEGRPSAEVLPAGLLALTAGSSCEVALAAGEPSRRVVASVSPTIGPDGPVFVVTLVG
jgi:PAS domain S-box-containing protein